MRAILLVALALTLAGCSTTDDTTTVTSTPVISTTPSASTPAATTPVVTTPSDDHEVEIEGFAFAPSTLNVPVGATVTWTNKDSAPHTATADGGAFTSGNLAKDGEFSHTFATDGTFAYHCAFHSNMKGTIVVGTGVTPTPTPTTSTPPVSSTPTTSTPPAPVTREVAISNFAFVPAAVSLPVGSTVHWTNADSSGHTVTDDAGAFNSGRIGEGGEFSQTFTAAGTFPYHCAFHTDMKGTITVTA